ncbi:hypothetical protein DSO57_1006321 [Entomophthora muscae]|uniref:Uncharacterized protein n=1 Tax=Entomophthora muscae TaxID=34485 RepID=A0ACC2T7T8_9FUNG|nr:hypothetical protein DSO57_1006321 [Entomophthora muscae]
MQQKHLDYLFEKLERDAFKLVEIHGISAESLAEILKVLHKTKTQDSISGHKSAPTEITHKYTGPFPTGKFYSRGVPLRACRDSSKSPHFLQFSKGQMLILIEKNGPVARGYIQSDPLKKQGEINLQDVQFDLRFEDEYFSEVDTFASSLEESCAQSINQLAEHLTRRYEDSMIFQLRSIYTWICYHISYDAESFFGPPEARASNEARDVLKTRLAVCAGYANLFLAVCEAVPLLAREVRVKVVSGYGRGYDSTIHMERIPRTNFGYSNHAWNSVFIDGLPFFVESTWGAGNLNGRTFVQKFSSSYFLSPPQDFVRLHFPSKTSDQHLIPAITEEEFCSFPVLSAPFYKYDLALVSHNTSPVTIGSDDFLGGKRMVLKLKVPREFGLRIRFTAKLSCDKPVGGSSDIEVFSQPSVEGWDFYIPQ